jgi:zinc protease
MLAGANFARDSLRGGASAIGTALTIGLKIDDVEQWPGRIKAVTRDQVLAAARYVLRPERSVTALLLPDDPSAHADERRSQRPPTSRASKETVR